MGRLNAWNVDDKVLGAFKNFVLAKHGKLHSALSEEVTNALREYLQGKGTHTQNLSGKALKEAEVVKKEILKQVDPGGSLPQKMLENIVRQVSGVMDKRSVRNRIEALVAVGFLQRDWRVSIEGKVFRVVGDETGKIG